MLWFAISVLAIMVGFAMFTKVQPDLPDELSFLKNKALGAQVLTQGTDRPAANLQAIPSADGSITGWLLRSEGANSEATRDFDQDISGPNGQTYDKPAFGLTCYQGRMYVRVNTRMRAAGQAPLSFDVKGMPGWSVAQNQNWYSMDAAKAIASLKGRSSVKVAIAFEETGTQTFNLNIKALPTVISKMNGCTF